MTEYTFPAFRTAEWIKELIDSQYCFPGILEHVDLTPEYMASTSSAALFKTKSLAAKEQIRRALFRHSLFKIQNTEVTFVSCKDPRILLEVSSSTREGEGWSAKLIDRFLNEKTTQFVSQELWTVDRCGSPREYAVRYYREGPDGFRTRVIPRSVVDKVGLLRYYFSS